MMRSFITAALEKDGFQVSTAKSGLEALKKLQQDRFQLIVASIHLPDLNGGEVVRALRDKAPQSPIVIVSEKGRERERAAALAQGATDSLTRPFSPQELLDVARRTAGR